MRIDDLNSAAQAQETAKSDAVRLDRARGTDVSLEHSDPDAAQISELANALSPSDARLEALSLQVERGEYHPSAKDVAARIIDQHTGRQ